MSGTVQTENIGFEKIVCNVVANPNLIKKAVWSCYQEKPVDFKDYILYDPGAFPQPPLSGKITMRVTQPWVEPPDEKERETVKKAKELMKRLKTKSKEKSR